MTAILLLQVFGVGAFAGFFGSLLGLGGGLFMIPFFTLYLNLPVHSAVGLSLVSIVATSCGASSNYIKNEMVDMPLSVALLFSTSIGAVAGAFLSYKLNASTIKMLFSFVLFYMFFNMIKNSKATKVAAGSAVKTPEKIFYVSLSSVAAGMLSGLLGIGGGVVYIPSMHLIMKMPFIQCIANSSYLIGATASVSAMIYLFRGDITPELAVISSVGVFAGARGGSFIAPKIPQEKLRTAFSLLLIYFGIRMFLSGAGY